MARLAIILAALPVTVATAHMTSTTTMASESNASWQSSFDRSSQMAAAAAAAAAVAYARAQRSKPDIVARLAIILAESAATVVTAHMTSTTTMASESNA